MLAMSGKPQHHVSADASLQIEVEIMRYLAEHPDAKDTVEGIAGWWMLERRMQASVADVKAGLDRLVASGRMRAEQHADGRIYYHRPK